MFARQSMSASLGVRVLRVLQRVPQDVDRAARRAAGVQLVHVLVATVPPRRVSEIMAALVEQLPLTDRLGHLKRVRRDRTDNSINILVGPADDRDVEKIVTESLLDGLNVRRLEVPRDEPLCQEEMETYGKIWPVIYKPSSKLAAADVDEEEALSMLAYLRKAVTVAETAAVGDGAGAVLVHPKTKAVVATAADASDRSSCAPSKVLRHAVMECITNAAIPRSSDGPANNREHRADDGAIEQYLCTGLDMYVSREPCIMCAMALVHSRIRRVIYGQPIRNGIVGGLSNARIHVEQKLNHRYDAFYLPIGSIDTDNAATPSSPRGKSETSSIQRINEKTTASR